jgi:DNA-binding transcriptional regulator YiaG
MARKKWSEIKAGVPPEVRQRAAARTRGLSAAVQLDELRRLVGLTQEELAGRLGTNQPSVSKLERRDDMYLSTLHDVVAAMGGSLEIYARFPDRFVRLR